MVVGHVKDLEKKTINSPLVEDVAMQVLVSPKEGWTSHVMRVFDVGPGGHTPKHQHPWPHINYIIAGSGEVMVNHISYKITEGSYAYVPSNTIHQFQNTGNETLRFICIVPTEGHK